jgi:rod shape-determining protein MreB
MPNIGIDLGTAHTLVYVAGKGIVFDEASAIAIDDRSNSIIAYGNRAEEMLGRTPASIRVIKPLSTGVISDFVSAKSFIDLILNRIVSRRFFKPIQIVIGVPSRISGAEYKALQDALNTSRISKVYAVQEPVAAAIGSGLNFAEPRGCLVIDIGAGTCDIALMSLGRVVNSKSVKVGGDAFVAAFVNYLANELRLNVGFRTAEEFLKKNGQAFIKNKSGAVIQGVDMSLGLPVNFEVAPEMTMEAIKESISLIVGELKRLLDSVPPDLAADALNDGIHLTGGGSLLAGLPELITESTGIPCKYVEQPMSAVVTGCGLIVEDLEKYKFVLEDISFELSATSAAQ